MPASQLTSTARLGCLNHVRCFGIFWSHDLNPFFRFESVAGFTRPFLYKKRVTIRNYLKLLFANGASRHRTIMPDSVVSVVYPHPSWGTGQSEVLYSPGVPEPSPVLFFIDGRFDTWDGDSLLMRRLARTGYVCVRPSDRVPFRVLASDRKLSHVLIAAMDDLCDLLGGVVDTPPNLGSCSKTHRRTEPRRCPASCRRREGGGIPDPLRM